MQELSFKSGKELPSSSFSNIVKRTKGPNQYINLTKLILVNQSLLDFKLLIMF